MEKEDKREIKLRKSKSRKRSSGKMKEGGVKGKRSREKEPNLREEEG